MTGPKRCRSGYGPFLLVLTLVTVWAPAAGAQGAGTSQVPVRGGFAPAPDTLALLGLKHLIQTRSRGDIQLSPDGNTVAYVVREMDLDGDRWRSAIRLAPLGKRAGSQGHMVTPGGAKPPVIPRRRSQV